MGTSRGTTDISHHAGVKEALWTHTHSLPGFAKANRKSSGATRLLVVWIVLESGKEAMGDMQITNGKAYVWDSMLLFLTSDKNLENDFVAKWQTNGKSLITSDDGPWYFYKTFKKYLFVLCPGKCDVQITIMLWFLCYGSQLCNALSQSFLSTTAIQWCFQVLWRKNNKTSKHQTA